MSIYSHTEDKASPTRSPDEDRQENSDTTTPAEPTPEHPRHDHEGARRTYKRLKSGRWTWHELCAREWGLLAYWYPWLFAEWVGGEP